MNPTDFRESSKLDEAKATGDETALFAAALRFARMVVGVKLNRKEPELSSEIACKIVMGEFTEGDAKFSTWAWKTAMNAISDWLRERYSTKHLVPLEQAEHHPGPSILDDIENRKALGEALSHLAPSDRKLVRLKLDGDNFREIGEQLGISTTRAFERWRAILKELEENNNGTG